MKWPIWIPYPGQWLRAGLIIMCWLPIGAGIRIGIVWGAILSAVFEHPGIGLVIAGLTSLLVTAATAAIHHKLFGPDGVKTITGHSWWAANFAIYGPLVASIPVVIIAVGLSLSLRRHEDLFALLYVTSFAYLCQMEYLVRQRLKNRPHRQVASRSRT
jgi:hypothetical protein